MLEIVLGFLEPILYLLLVVLVIAMIVRIMQKKRLNNGVCKSCKTELTPDDVTIVVSDLFWKVEETSERSYVSYYCFIVFTKHCPKCGKIKSFTKNFTLHDSDYGYSRRLGEIRDSIVNKVKAVLPKKFFETQEPVIGGIDELMVELKKKLC